MLVGRGANDRRGVVVEMEFRRRSGRGVGEVFFLPSLSSGAAAKKMGEKVMLLDDHPLYRGSDDVGSMCSAADEVGEELSTFDLGITAKQRRDREGVVLPYFDAQEGGGGGEGGRILYDLGVEDDFDEEEDEI